MAEDVPAERATDHVVDRQGLDGGPEVRQKRRDAAGLPFFLGQLPHVGVDRGDFVLQSVESDSTRPWEFTNGSCDGSMPSVYDPRVILSGLQVHSRKRIQRHRRIDPA